MTTKPCRACAEQIASQAKICRFCGTDQATGRQGTSARPPKDKNVAILLALFLGGLGIHKFYLGNSCAGVMYLLFSWTFIPLILGAIEAVGYLMMTDQSFHQKYG